MRFYVVKSKAGHYTVVLCSSKPRQLIRRVTKIGELFQVELVKASLLADPKGEVPCGIAHSY